MQWNGVLPALTTCFNEDLSIDHDFVAKHCQWLVDHGCRGIVALGSLGEGATLTFEEKTTLLETCIAAVGKRVPVIAGVSSLSTDEAVRLAKASAARGCRGLMVLPPYVYSTDWREMKAHVRAVIRATDLPCMLYNNPVAYRTDFLPEHIQELAAENDNLEAVKESSADTRRVTAIRALLGKRIEVLVGVDDAIVEGIDAGATGWIAGLANAFPQESVALFEYATHGECEKTFSLYKWFLPLLRMDTVPKFVQLIKLVQERVGMGRAQVRPPRLTLAGAELDSAEVIIRNALKNRPSV